MWRLLRYLIGADVFISYARKDSGAYAGRLADRLKSEPGVSVYLDQDLSPVGRELPSLLLRHLKLSRRLVVIVSDAALQSVPVQREVEAFAGTPRPVIPIDALDEGERPSWPGLHGAFWRTESVDRLRAGTPSEETIAEILDAIGADRQSRRTRRAAWTALALIVISVLAGVVISDRSLRQKERAEWRALEAGLVTQRQQRLARNARRDFELANRDRGIAEHAAAHQRNVTEATAMLNEAESLLRQEPDQLQSATILMAAATRRLDQLDVRSISADLTLRRALSQVGRIERWMPFEPGARLGCASRDGRFVAAVVGRTIVLWAVDSGRSRRLSFGVGTASFVDSLLFSRDGSHLMADLIAQDGKRTWTRVWRTSDGVPKADALLHRELLKGIALSHDGKWFATGSYTGVRVWTSDDNHCVKERSDLDHWGGPTFTSSPAGDLAFSPSSKFIAASNKVWEWQADPDSAVKLTSQRWGHFEFDDEEKFAMFTGNAGVTVSALEDEFHWKGEIDPLGNSTAVLVGGRFAALLGARGIEFRALDSGSVVARIAVEHSVTVSERDSVVAIGCSDGTARVYKFDPAGGFEVARVGHAGGAPAVAMRADGRVVSVGTDGALLWSGQTADIRKESGRRVPSAFAFAPDSNRFAVIDDEWKDYGWFCIRDASTAFKSVSSPLDLDWAERPVLGFGGDGTVAAATADGAYVWRSGHGAEVRRLLGAGSVGGIQVSRNGRIVAASSAQEVVIWRRDEPRRPVARLRHPAAVEALAFGSSDEEIVTLAADHQLRRWRWTGQSTVQQASVVGPEAEALAMLGPSMVAVIEGRNVVVRDLAHGEAPVIETIQHEARVVRIAGGRHGFLATIDERGSVRVWRVRPEKPAEVLTKFLAIAAFGTVAPLALSDDGRFIVTHNGLDLEIRSLLPRDLVAHACAQVAPMSSAIAMYARACANR